MNDDLNASVNDLELEFRDAVKDPNDPKNQTLESEIPQRYKEKTREDLIDMHVNLEKVLSRQGSEVGQLRKLVDSQTQLLLKATALTPQTEPRGRPSRLNRFLTTPNNLSTV